MERIMAVLDRDRQYAERLCDYTNRRRNLPFQAVAFQAFREYSSFADTHRVLLLLAEPDLIGGEYELKADKVLSLCEEEVQESSAGGLVSCDGSVYKYQSGDAILREAMSAVGDIGERFRMQISNRQTQLITVYSPLNRCYKSAFALLYAVLRAKRERVLYLNFEVFSGLSKLLGEQFRTGLSDALYHFKQGTLDASRIASFLHRFYEVDYIPPQHLAEDLTATEAEDFAGFLDLLMRETDYDCIVEDAGGFSAVTAELMSMSDLVFMPVLEDQVSEGKLADFEAYLEYAGRSALKEKIRRLQLPVPGVIRHQEGYFDSLLLSPLGDFVRGLL